jgi:hypothetical protein
MVGSSMCHLHGMSEKALMQAGECPYDPQSYFIISGIERRYVQPVRVELYFLYVLTWF